MRYLTLALTLLFSPLAANCTPPWYCGTFEVEGVALYLRPTSCELPFAISDVRPFTDTTSNNAHLPSGQLRGINPSYEGGFRVGLAYRFGCYDVGFVYSRLHTEDAASLSAPLWPTHAHPHYEGLVNGTGANNLFAQSPFFSDAMEEGRGRGRVGFEHDAIDLQFAKRSCKAGRLWLRPYLGLHLADILHRFHGNYRGILEPDQAVTATASTTYRFKACSWGIGPLAGLDLRYPVICGFGLGGHVGLALLGGERDRGIFAQDIHQMIFFHKTEKGHIFPYLRAGLGVNYSFCLCGFRGVIELAYEFHSYINALHTFRFNDERATGISDCHSFDLNGLALSIHLQL